MKAIRINKNNINKPSNNKKIILFSTSICLFVIIIIGLVLGLGLKTRNNNNDTPSYVGRNNLIEIKNTNYKNYYYYSGKPFREFFQSNIKVKDGSYYVNSDFKSTCMDVYMGDFSVFTESTKKNFYLNLDDSEKKTNV